MTMNTKNNSLNEIAAKLMEADNILLFPHVNLDGDALGSCTALCKALRKLGKTAWVLLEDEIPSNLKFMNKGYCTWDKDQIKNPEICMCIDCGDTSRFEKRVDKFKEGKTTICVDHHTTTEFFCDLNYVDAMEAATGQIIFELLGIMGIEPDWEIGEAIFVAITTDTGKYQYSNTQKKSHLITAELYDWGVDFNGISVEIYENVRMEKMLMKGRALETLKLLGDGTGAMVCVTQKLLEETGATMDEAEGLSQDLRSIAGVEYSAVVKEYEPELCKVSMRAKSMGDVATIASKFGGGGHLKAAGCTIRKPIEEVSAIIEKELLKAIAELSQ